MPFTGLQNMQPRDASEDIYWSAHLVPELSPCIDKYIRLAFNRKHQTWEDFCICWSFSQTIWNNYVSEEDDQVYKHDITNPTLEDHFDMTVLPKVMQVILTGTLG
jgi:hypothetical protein